MIYEDIFGSNILLYHWQLLCYFGSFQKIITYFVSVFVTMLEAEPNKLTNLRQLYQFLEGGRNCAAAPYTTTTTTNETKTKKVPHPLRETAKISVKQLYLQFSLSLSVCKASSPKKSSAQTLEPPIPLTTPNGGAWLILAQGLAAIFHSHFAVLSGCNTG